LVTFSGKPIEPEEFLNLLVAALGFTIDTRLSKERIRDRMCLFLLKTLVKLADFFKIALDELIDRKIREELDE